jgi:DNA-binding transcriptional MerR regulator
MEERNHVEYRRGGAGISGVSAKMIRHYEAIGLLPAARAPRPGYRVYGEQDVRLLQFIHRGRALGFSLEKIAGLLALWQDKDRASADVRRLAEQHIDELNRKIDELQAMKRTLEHAGPFLPRRPALGLPDPGRPGRNAATQ